MSPLRPSDSRFIRKRLRCVPNCRTALGHAAKLQVLNLRQSPFPEFTHKTTLMSGHVCHSCAAFLIIEGSTILERLAKLSAADPAHDWSASISAAIRNCGDANISASSLTVVCAPLRPSIFNGRIFSDVSLRLGRVGERGMSEDGHNLLATNDLGRFWFSGADKRWIEIMQRHDGEALLSYGLRQDGQQDFSGHSAFLLIDEPMTDDIRRSVRTELKNALGRW